MHGLGNDFMVIDGVTEHISLDENQIKQMADRRYGVGFDQLLIVEPPLDPENDFRYRIFNADGYEVEHCGNGARCFARFVTQKGLTNKNPIKVETMTGEIELKIREDELVAVDMGKPIFAPENIPFNASQEASQYNLSIEYNGQNENITFGALSLGNPHAVITVDSIDTAPVQSLGPILEKHPAFPLRVNVGFMEILDHHQINLRVFERGVGETPACGTGACAAVAYGVQTEKLDSPVTVNLPGGQLEIEYSGGDSSILMTGPAVTVFEGKIQL